MSKNWSRKKKSDVSAIDQAEARQPRKPENYFETTLKTCRFELTHQNSPNELNCDQAIFLRDLEKHLADNKNSKAIEKLISGFQEYIENEIQLKWSLMPTNTAAFCDSARNASQDSLIHLLLNIELIQEQVASIMLDKLAEFSYSESSVLYDRAENKSVACLIVSQFKWLNKLVNGEALSEKLIQLIEATPSGIQKDIIKLLPEVITEFDHSKVAKSLIDILKGNQELNVTILDALTNLNIDSDLISEIRKKEIDIILLAKVSDLPIIVKFILQDLTLAEMSDTIHDLRKNLDFNSTFFPIVSSTPIEPKIRESPKDIASCVLNTIKQTLNFQKPLCDAWLKVLESLHGSQNHKSLDILIMLVLLSLDINRKKVENTLKNKIKVGDINEDLLHVTFRCHHEILQEYASVLLHIAESLLRNTEPTISTFGCSLYIKCFIWFNSYYKQEIISNLITHIGNKSESEVNAALDTLISLVQRHTSKIAPYSLFVKTFIDYLDSLTLNQIRKVYEILSILAYLGGREGSMLLDDLLIVIRKQLTSRNLRFRKMGVVGALMAAKSAASKENDEFSSDTSVSSDLLNTTTCYEHSIKLLELVVESTCESHEAFALFCDELSLIMLQKKIGKTVMEWVGDKILAEFEENYIIDINPDDYVGKEICPRYALDEVNEPVALNLYNIVLKNCDGCKITAPKDSGNLVVRKADIGNESRVLNTLLKISTASTSSGSESEFLPSPIKLPPVFRLLRIFKQIQDGNLEAIDALLGCSIVLPDLCSLKVKSLPTSEQHLMIDTLFYCINWIRENINAFATSTEEDIKCNVLTRLQLLVELEDLVCSYITEVRDYSPPVANFDCDENQLLNLKLAPKKVTAKRKAKDKNKKSKKAKTDEDSTQNQSKTIDSSKSLNSDSDDFEIKTISDTSILKKLSPYFRELDFDVFILLNSAITFKNRVDVFANERVTSLQMHTKELKFLLEDLNQKLIFCFGTSAISIKIVPKKIGFSNLESLGIDKIISNCIDVLPSLCNILETCGNFFKTLKEDNDGIEDSLILYTADTQRIVECMNLIFKVMNQIFSWKSLNLNDYSSVLKKLLMVFSSRLDSSIETSSVYEIVGHTISYFNLFANSVPSLLTAANLMQLLTTFLYFLDDSEPQQKVSAIALNFLKKSWPEIDSKFPKTALINENVKILLEAYLNNRKEILKSLEYLAAEAIPQIINDDVDAVFNTLNKASMICYYKIMFAKLSDYMKTYFSKKQNDVDRLYEWSIAFKIFQVLTTLLKTFGARSYIVICLKNSREFMTTFLKYGMPFMDKLFASHQDEVICLMKTLQVSTRYLQHVCNHSKVVKDVSLISHVPFLKKSLEMFVFRVKIMLAVHKCDEAFWLGNLKNRDLKGAEILSQSSALSGDESEEENERDDINPPKSDSDASGIGSDGED